MYSAGTSTENRDDEDPCISEINIYAYKKDALIKLLTSYGLYADDSDKSEVLRPLAASLKGAVITCKRNRVKRNLLQGILNRSTPLTEAERAEHTELAYIEDEINTRYQRFLDCEEEFEPRYSNLKDTLYPQSTGFQLPRVKLFQNSPNSETEPVNPELLPKSKSVSSSSHSLTSSRNSLDMPSEENLPLIEGGTFNGLPSENVTDFIDHYSLAAESNNWKDPTKLKLFPAHLTGSAKIWFTLYKARTQELTWDLLVQDFKRAFTYCAQADSLVSLMAKKTQGNDEPVLNYFLEIVSTCKRYKPTISEKEIIRYFLQSVKPEYCKFLATLKNDTLAEVEGNLLAAEKFVSLNNQNEERYAKQTSNFNKGSSEFKNQVHHVSFKSEDDETLKDEIRDLKLLVQNLQVSLPRDAPNSSPRGYTANKFHDSERRSRSQSPAQANYNDRYDQARHRSPHYARGRSNSPTVKSRDRPEIYCHICEARGHTTQSCWHNQKSGSFRPQYGPKYRTNLNDRERFPNHRGRERSREN